jgi:DNA-binding response OmpR family regulator
MDGTGPYDNVAIVVGDSNPHLCDAIRTTLDEEGLTNVETCLTPDALIEAIDDRIVDLILVDHLLDGPHPEDLIQRIRRKALGRNPFVAIIAMIDAEAPAAAKTMAESGVDKVVAKPLTVDQLFKRVTNLTRKRTPYIVSSRYIGPSRREVERADERPTIMRETPNTLRSRLIDKTGEDEIERMIERAAEQLRGDRFDATAMEIDFLVTGISAFYTTGGSHEDWRTKLRRLIWVAEGWRADHDGPSKDVIFDLAGMLINLAKRILGSSPTQRIVQVDLLVQLSQAVRASMDIDHREAHSFEEITRIISRFTKDD